MLRMPAVIAPVGSLQRVKDYRRKFIYEVGSDDDFITNSGTRAKEASYKREMRSMRKLDERQQFFG